jgi:hypothetical protein
MHRIKAGGLLIAFFSLSPLLFSQDRTAAILKDIRDKYQEINAARPAYRKVWTDAPGATTEGGEVIGYFLKDTIRLIEEILYGEMGKSQTSVYYDKGAPVFIFLRESTYNVPFYDSTFKSSLTKVAESRSYFYQGKMIRWIDPEKKIFSARDKTYIENEASSLSLAKELYDRVMAADTSRKVPPPDKSKAK